MTATLCAAAVCSWLASRVRRQLETAQFWITRSNSLAEAFADVPDQIANLNKAAPPIQIDLPIVDIRNRVAKQIETGASSDMKIELPSRSMSPGVSHRL